MLIRSTCSSGAGASPYLVLAAFSTGCSLRASVVAAAGTWAYGEEAISSLGARARSGHRSQKAAPSARAKVSAAVTEPYLYRL